MRSTIEVDDQGQETGILSTGSQGGDGQDPVAEGHGQGTGDQEKPHQAQWSHPEGCVLEFLLCLKYFGCD